MSAVTLLVRGTLAPHRVISPGRRLRVCVNCQVIFEGRDYCPNEVLLRVYKWEVP